MSAEPKVQAVDAIPEASRVKLAPFRDAFQAATFPAVAVPGALTAEAAEAIRARLADQGLQPFHLAHRGRYAFTDTFDDPPLFARLCALAEHLAGARLAITGARVTRLGAGDYVLTRDDTAATERSLELCVDLSAEAASAGGEACYTHRGQLVFVVPQEPGTLALIERGPSVRRYERYLSLRAGEGEVVRLRLTLGRREG